MLIKYFINNWKYSNAPEGQQPFEKVAGLCKYGFAGSLSMGVYDAITISQTAGFWNTVNCLSYWVIPVTAMCATFASVAYTSTKIRGKDDYANYILASIAAGGICYKWQKKGQFAYYFTIVLIGCSMIKKYGDMIGWNPMPLNAEVRSQQGPLPYDLTISMDRWGRRPW